MEEMPIRRMQENWIDKKMFVVKSYESIWEDWFNEKRNKAVTGIGNNRRRILKARENKRLLLNPRSEN